jgi:C4-dicarboxylate-specific signal transduction histidine kinase
VSEALLKQLGGSEAIRSVLDVVCQTTGMGFAAVAHLTDSRWVAYQVRDDIAFGLVAGGELPVERTLCDTVRGARNALVIDDVSTDPVYREHPVPVIYGLQSYIAVPILLEDGEVFGTLCAIDRKPRRVDTPEARRIFTLLAQLIATQVDRFRMTTQNETLEQRVADALAEKKVYADIVESSTAAVTALGLDWRILAINRTNLDAFERVYGKRPAVGDDFLSLFHDAPEYVEQQRAIWSRALQGEAFMVVQDFGNARIERRTYEVRFSSLLNGKGERIGASSASYDVTDRVLAEARLAVAQAQLAYANRLETMGQLTASIAHEVNQPIAATVTNANAALRWLDRPTPDLEETKQALGRIVRDGTRAGAVVHRVRDLTKKGSTRDDRVEMNEAVREVIEFSRAEAVQRGVSVQTELAQTLPVIRGDRVELQQVLLNLILNAFEATSEVREGPRELRIKTGKTETGDVLVSVGDTGPGLSPLVQENLFKPFFTTKPTGLGFGLSICHSTVEAHGGLLWASANSPRGAVFHFTLPSKLEDTKPA